MKDNVNITITNETEFGISKVEHIFSPHESYEDFQIFSVVRRDQMYKTNNWVPIARFSMWPLVA